MHVTCERTSTAHQPGPLPSPTRVFKSGVAAQKVDQKKNVLEHYMRYAIVSYICAFEVNS